MLDKPILSKLTKKGLLGLALLSAVTVAETVIQPKVHAQEVKQNTVTTQVKNPAPVKDYRTICKEALKEIADLEKYYNKMINGDYEKFVTALKEWVNTGIDREKLEEYAKTVLGRGKNSI